MHLIYIVPTTGFIVAYGINQKALMSQCAPLCGHAPHTYCVKLEHIARKSNLSAMTTFLLKQNARVKHNTNLEVIIERLRHCKFVPTTPH